MTVAIVGPQTNTSAECGRILRALPNWFGIPEAIDYYVEQIEQLPTFLAISDGDTVGFMTVLKHNPYAAELFVLGVLSGYHRQGIGRALLNSTEEWLRAGGTEYLQVKTLGPSRKNEEYEQTRLYYEQMGFRPLEELKELWGEASPCLLMVKRL